MDPQSTTYIDKAHWGPGPWQDEPDRVEWRSGVFACLIVRGGGGALCGYVDVPAGHPWHGKDYGDVEAEVHGGLTFADACQEDCKICHVPQPGEAETVWWLGFDAGHAGDVKPQWEAQLRARYGWSSPLSESYKPIEYVRAEVERLAEQARQAGEG